MQWNDAKSTPLTARFTQGHEALEVDVLDLRPPSEFAKTPLPEVDPAVEKALREAFLLQRYGGPVVDPESIPGLGGGAALRLTPRLPSTMPCRLGSRLAGPSAWSTNGAPPSRRRGPTLLRREKVCMDGEDLRAIFARRQGPGAILVVEELGWRLDEEP